MILAESKQLLDFPFTSKSTLVKLSKKLRFCYKQGNKSNLMLIFWVIKLVKLLILKLTPSP